MHREGHVGAALLVYAPLGLVATVVAGTELALLGAVVAAGLSTLPDVDVRLPLARHRGPTHSLAFALLVGLVLAAVGGAGGIHRGLLSGLGGATFGFLVGAGTIVSHLAVDVITPMGIRPFWPVDSRHYSLALTPSANPIPNYALLAIGVTTLLVALAAGRWLAGL